MRWLLAVLWVGAAPAFAQDEPTSFIDCDIPAARFAMRTPADLNVLLFENGQTVAGTWRIEESYPAPAYGSFLAMVLSPEENTSSGMMSEIVLAHCPRGAEICIGMRSLNNGKSTVLPGSARMPMDGVGSFRLKREGPRRWIVELNGDPHVLDLPHDVTSFKLKCVGAKGWFNFASEPVS